MLTTSASSFTFFISSFKKVSSNEPSTDLSTSSAFAKPTSVLPERMLKSISGKGSKPRLSFLVLPLIV